MPTGRLLRLLQVAMALLLLPLQLLPLQHLLLLQHPALPQHPLQHQRPLWLPR